MPKLYESVKDLARAVGVYAWIRDAKLRTYCALRDWEWAIRFSMNRLLGAGLADITRMSREFDEMRFVDHLNKDIMAAQQHDVSYKAGASSPINLRSLYILCRVLRPTNVVETGVASGASSYVILSALEANRHGKLFSIDLPPVGWESQLPDYRKIDHVTLPKNETPGWLVPQSLKHRWELILGDSKQELGKLLERLTEIDIFYHDAEHTREAMLREYQTAWPHIRTGGVLASDDVGWSTAFAEFIAHKERESKSTNWFGFGMIQKLPTK